MDKKPPREARSASEERMRSVVDHVVDGIITIDARGIVANFNPAAERIFGYPAAEVVGRNVRMLMPEPDRSAHDSYLGNYLRTGEAKIIGIGREVTGRRKDGSDFPMELAISEFRLGEERYFTGIVRDITERKRAERELREAEERMRSVVDHVVDGIITIDESGRIESFNPAAEKIFGYSRPEVVGRNVKILMPEPYHGEHDGYIRNYVGTGQAKIIGTGREVLGRRRDGSTFPMELAVSEFHLGSRRFFTGIVRDITERKRLEEEVRRRLADLAEADRQKNEFLAMLSHELRNPLGPMRNALHILKLAGHDRTIAAGASGMMERQLQHLVRLVDDLLDVSRIVRGRIDLRREYIDLRDAAQRALEIAQPVVEGNGHAVHVEAGAPVPVLGDLIRLSQVISNLLTNAAKYSRTPGTISLSVRVADAEAELVVRDRGEGIAPELLPHVFDLFTQGDSTLARSRGGLGIGLTIVKRLVEMHEGRVAAHSAGPGRGSEFVIRLPLAPGVALAPPREAPGAEASRLRRRVLVVDDNVDAAESIGRILTLSGHEVQCAYDGYAALRLARNYQPEVVVLDIGLPGMDGYEVARRLREMDDFRHTPLVAVTGYGQEHDRMRSRQAGFDEHLTKPVDPEVLATFVGRGRLR